MSFSDIHDQDTPIRLLRNIIRLRRVPNALLFWGPEGVGKMLTAVALAKALNCLEAQGDACGKCLACRKIDSGNHPDVKIFRPAGKTRIFKTDVIDTINDLAAYRPFEGRRRVLIIEEADRMPPGAQNHFLKTLEEPASETSFVLVTQFSGRLLPTIRSRCQGVRFGALKPETVADILLRERDLPKDVAYAIAMLAQGQASRARDLADTEKRGVVLSVTERLYSGDDPLQLGAEFAGHMKAQGDLIAQSLAASAPAVNDALDADDREEAKKDLEAMVQGLVRREIMEYLYLFQTWYRDGLVYGATKSRERLLNADMVARVERECGSASPEKLEAIEKAWIQLERNIFMERVFRDLFLRLAA